VRIYAAELPLVLQMLHRQRLVRRNLKLESVLFAADGHLKLIDQRTDFGNGWHIMFSGHNHADDSDDPKRFLQ
jgi:serine/threonine protein kinase